MTSVSDVENLIPPITEKVLPNVLYTQLCELYKQLYPQYKIVHSSRSYMYSRRASIGGEVLVSASFNRKLCVVAAYWAGRGSDTGDFNIGCKRIGRILYFLKHTISLTSRNLLGVPPHTANIIKKHICYVEFSGTNSYHHQWDYFGSSAIACPKSLKSKTFALLFPLSA